MPSVEELSPTSHKAAFTHQMTHPLTFDLLLVKEMGAEYLEWEPETLWREVQLTWGTTVSEVSKNKIQAVRTIRTADTPYEQWEVFEKVATGLVGHTPEFRVMQRLSPRALGLGLDTLNKVRDTPKPAEELFRYGAACLLDHGVAYGPGPLEPCNKHVTKFVDPEIQQRVQLAVRRGKAPSFDGRDELDVQVMKSIALRDYQLALDKLLIYQVKTLVS